MACLVCGAEKTIKAHLIPQAFTKEVSLNTGEKHVVMHVSGEKYRSVDTGLFDDSILCAKCDGHIGQFEGNVYNLLCQARASKPQVNRLHSFNSTDGDLFVRFAAGLVWKYCVTKPSFGQVSIGPYSYLLKEVAFNSAPIPASVDVATVFLQDGSSDVYFYRAPKPDRQYQTNIVRFSVGGFVFFLKIDKRSNPPAPPNECWLRGKKACVFHSLPAGLFEEWNLHMNVRSQPRVKGYFDRMKAKAVK